MLSNTLDGLPLWVPSIMRLVGTGDWRRTVETGDWSDNRSGRIGWDQFPGRWESGTQITIDSGSLAKNREAASR